MTIWLTKWAYRNEPGLEEQHGFMTRSLRHWWLIILCCSPGGATTAFVILALASGGSASGISTDWLLRNCSLLAVPMLISIVGLLPLRRRADAITNGRSE